MKKLLTLLFLSVSLLINAQAPSQISYQGVARTTNGTVLSNSPIGIKFDIHQGSATGSIVFSETHTGLNTNAFGLFTTYIGSVNNLAIVNWAAGPFFIEVSIDPNTGTYNSLGSQQLMSVPYALYAGSAPAPLVSYTNNILSVGGNTTAITTGSTTYVQGNGISITGNTITNIAPNQTVNITGSGVSGAYPNYSITSPTVQTYSAGNGIDINASGVISNTAVVVTPTIIGTNGTQVNGTYPNLTITSPTVQTYSAGSGIDINASGVISNTAVVVTPTIIGTNGTQVNGTYPNLTITSPTVQTYSAGNGIGINALGVISNTAIAVTPTITGLGTTTVNGTYPTLTIETPTVAPDQIVSLLGINAATVTGAYPNFTVNVPTGTTLPNGFNGQLLFHNGTVWDTIPRNNLFFDGTNFGIGTTSPQANFHVVGRGIFNSDLTTPQIYTDNIKITGGTSGQILTSDPSGNGTWQNLPTVSTPTIISGGVANTTNPSTNVYIVDVPAPALSYTNATNVLSLSQNGSVSTVTLTGLGSNTINIVGSGIAAVTPTTGSNFTVNVPSPAYTSNGPTTITGSYPNYTVNSVVTPSTTLIQGNNITLNQSANTYTISSPAYSITLPGGNTVLITNGISTSTAAINATNLTLTGVNNNILSAGGNTVGLNNYDAGSNLARTGIAPNYTLSAPSYSLTSNSNTLTLNNGVSITTATVPAITLPILSYTAGSLGGKLQSGPATNTVSIPNYTITNTTNTISISNGVATSSVAIPVPVLSITGNTLQSGPLSNTITLPAGISGTGTQSYVPVWTTTNSIGSSTISDQLGNIGINGLANNEGRFVITHNATTAYPSFHLKETSGALSRIKFSNIGVANKYFEAGASNNATDANAAYSLSYFDGATYKSRFLVYGNGMTSINNLNTALGTFHVQDNTTNGGIISEGFNQPAQVILARNNQTALTRIAVNAGDNLGNLIFSGYNNAGNYNGNSAKISAKATEAFTSVSQGSDMLFSTVKLGTVTTLNVLKLGDNGDVIVNPNNDSNNSLFYAKTRVRLDSSLTFGGYNATSPPQSFVGEGRIYYDRTLQKFRVSENNQPYVNLIGGGSSPWIQGAGVITQSITTDKVGIGTNTPTFKLDVTGNARFTSGIESNGQIILNNSGNYQSISISEFGGLGAGINLQATNGGHSYTMFSENTSGNLLFEDETVGTTRMIINAGGKVGINTTSPNAMLDVVSTTTNTAAAGFINNSTLNGSDALIAKTVGTGAAIRASLGPAVAGSSNVGILLEEGHFKSIQAIPVAAASTSLGLSSGVAFSGGIVNITMDGTSSDAKGIIRLNLNSILAAGAQTGDYSVFIPFNKAYTNASPVVMISPISNMMPTSNPNISFNFYTVSSANGYIFHLSYKTTSPIGTAVTIPLNFNYFVID